MLICLQYIDVVREMQVPIAWTSLGGLTSFVFYLIARTRKVKRSGAYAMILGYSSLPGVLFLSAEIMLPNGAATYITGPASYLYYFMVVLSGFAFDERLSLLAGIFCGAQYITFFLISKNGLNALSSTDILMLNDITDPAIYFFKSLMMIFCGILVGILVKNAKRFLNEILEKEQEKSRISRLFGQFVSEEVKEKLMGLDSPFKTERKKAAILFSDIRSFTSLSETADPEELLMHLNEYFERMVGAIVRNGGTIDKFIGDAVMAVFGGIIELPNPSEAATAAALEMRRELGELKKQWQLSGVTPMENGIGIHYGEVVQGSVGSKDRMDFTVIGDAVNTASRLEGLCGSLGFPIIMSEEVFLQLSPVLKDRFQEGEQVSVKGKSKPIQIYLSKDLTK